MAADPGFGIPGWFVGLFVLGFALTVGSVIWRISVARRIARDNGLDPRDATAVALLDQDGLSATYMRAGLRGGAGRAPARSTEDRLAELDRLRSIGAISDDEYATARARILGAL